MQISKSVQHESYSSWKNESNENGIETIGVHLEFLGPKQETFPHRKVSEIRDTETFRIAKFPNLRYTIPNHSKYYFITLGHLFVHSRHVPRLNSDPGYYI